MKTENFSLTGATGVFMRQGIIRVLRYDEGDAGGPTPLIRVTSMSGSDVDVEMKPGRLINLKEPINGMVIRNLSGATITGKFTWGDGNVEDNTFSGIFDLTTATINALINAKYNTRPESPNGNYKNNAAIVANTAEAVFAAGVNTAGAIVLAAGVNVYGGGSAPLVGFVAKATAPANPLDGDPVFVEGETNTQSGAGNLTAGRLQIAQYVPAGLGLFFISDTATGAAGGSSLRHCRFRLLP